MSLMESTMSFTQMPQSPREILSILPTKSRESSEKSAKSLLQVPNVVSSPMLLPSSKMSLMESTMSFTPTKPSPREILSILPIKLRESSEKSAKSLLQVPNVVSSPMLPPSSKMLLMESTMSFTQMPQSPREILSILPTKSRESSEKSAKSLLQVPNVVSSPMLLP